MTSLFLMYMFNTLLFLLFTIVMLRFKNLKLRIFTLITMAMIMFISITETVTINADVIENENQISILTPETGVVNTHTLHLYFVDYEKLSQNYNK